VTVRSTPSSQVRIGPHLIFDGRCREAFLAYRDILGGELATLLTYGESPLAGSTDPRYRDRIVHATLKLPDGVELAGADVMPNDYERPRGFFVALTLEGTDRARGIFAALAEGGEVGMPFQATFWSPGFGVLVDRFGIPWEVNAA
jgi:PhnB protein